VYGGLFHLVTHAVAKALLFLSVGALIYATSARAISQLGGLATISNPVEDPSGHLQVCPSRIPISDNAELLLEIAKSR